jgi:hypothetical protein
VAPVTIDNADYIFARAYDLALDAADTLVADSVARSFIAYVDTVTGYYEAQARAIVGYELPQVLLLRQNRLNAHHLDDSSRCCCGGATAWRVPGRSLAGADSVRWRSRLSRRGRHPVFSSDPREVGPS